MAVSTSRVQGAVDRRRLIGVRRPLHTSSLGGADERRPNRIARGGSLALATAIPRAIARRWLSVRSKLEIAPEGAN